MIFEHGWFTRGLYCRKGQNKIIICMQVAQPIDLNQRIIKHYHKQTTFRRAASINSPLSPTKSTLKARSDLYKPIEVNPEELHILLKNDKHMTFDSPGLEFKQLPGNLKIHFNRPPSPPPHMEAVPYTYEIVPMQRVKLPKRKRGQMADWVYEEMGWEKEKDKTKEKEKGKTKEKERVDFRRIDSRKSDNGDRFMRGGRTIAKSHSLAPSIYEIVKQEMKSKPYQHYNSIEFFKLVKDGNLQEVELSLKETPTLAMDFDDQKMTPLHWASRQGHTEIVKLLVQKFKANVNAQDKYGRTPLYIASQNRKNECIYRLFIEGADLLVATFSRKTAKDVAPDLYTKYALQKVEEIKKILDTRRVPEHSYKQALEAEIRTTLDPSSAYF